MKTKLGLLVFFLLALVTGPLHAAPAPRPLIESQWQYDGFFYDGVRYPNPNPDLVLVFTFYDDGLGWFYWYRKNEKGFCESLQTFEVDGDVLRERSLWENPLNGMNCSDGAGPADEISVTQFSIEGEELRLHLELDGRPFLYILKYIGQATPASHPEDQEAHGK